MCVCECELSSVKMYSFFFLFVDIFGVFVNLNLRRKLRRLISDLFGLFFIKIIWYLCYQRPLYAFSSSPAYVRTHTCRVRERVWRKRNQSANLSLSPAASLFASPTPTGSCVCLKVFPWCACALSLSIRRRLAFAHMFGLYNCMWLNLYKHCVSRANFWQNSWQVYFDFSIYINCNFILDNSKY